MSATAPQLSTTPVTAGRVLPLAHPAPPSFPLIAGHFAAGFGWVLAGAVSLVWLAPVLARGDFLDPRVLGLTHLFTLGWITTVIMGVLYQIFPAMLGVGVRSLRIARVSLAAQTAGTALLACGLAAGWHALQAVGWSLVFAAIFGVAWNLLPQRRRAERNHQLGIYISYGHMGLGFAAMIGGARIGDALGWWTTPRLPLLAAHFHFAAVGFATMTAFGLSSRMLPMFLGATDPPGWSIRWIPRIIATGTVGFAAGMLTASPVLDWLGALAMASGAGMFLWQAAGWYRHRSRRALDPATTLTLFALVSLGVAIPLGARALLLGPLATGTLIGYVALLLLGWLTSLILGVSCRVLPTLTWHHRFGARAGRPGTPTLPQLLTPSLGWATVILHGSGITLLTAGLLAASSSFTRAGALLLLAGLVAITAHHGRMLLLGRTTGSRP